MKTIVLGDIHGMDIWKQIVIENDWDKVVFLGDYFDTHNYITPKQQIDNFKELIEYKNQNKDRVVLLLGNHDFHYTDEHEHYSGYQPLMSLDFKNLLVPAIKDGLIQICYVDGNIICTHAGITKTWCKNNIGEYFNSMLLGGICDTINDLLTFTPNIFRFTGYDMYGDDVTQSPIWVRPRSLIKDGIDNCFQIVGHTMQGKILFADNKYFIDTLGTSGEYLEIVDGKINICKI